MISVETLSFSFYPPTLRAGAIVCSGSFFVLWGAFISEGGHAAPTGKHRCDDRAGTSAHDLLAWQTQPARISNQSNADDGREVLVRENEEGRLVPSARRPYPCGRIDMPPLASVFRT